MGKLKMVAAAAAASVLALAAGAASAAAYVGTIPGLAASNQFLNLFTGGSSVQGWYGANLYLVGGPATIQVEYFGAEAGADNTFDFASGGCVRSHAGGTGDGAGTFSASAPAGLGGEDVIVANCSVANVASGLLDFLFTTSAGLSVVNGANRDNTDLTSNYFMTFDSNYALDTTTTDGTRGSGQSVFIFFDDSGAANDDNHDDMVIRLSITGGSFTVPL